MENANNLINQLMMSQVGGISTPATGVFSAGAGDLLSAGSFGAFAQMLLGGDVNTENPPATEQLLSTSTMFENQAKDNAALSALLGNLINDENKNAALGDVLQATSLNNTELDSGETQKIESNNIAPRIVLNEGVVTKDVGSNNPVDKITLVDGAIINAEAKLTPTIVNIAPNNKENVALKAVENIFSGAVGNILLDGGAIAEDAKKEIARPEIILPADVKTGEELTEELLVSGMLQQGMITQISVPVEAKVPASEVIEEAVKEGVSVAHDNSKKNLANLVLNKPEIVTNLSTEEFVVSKTEPTALSIVSGAADDAKIKFESNVSDAKFVEAKTFAGGINVKNDSNNSADNNAANQQNFNLNQAVFSKPENAESKDGSSFLKDSEVEPAKTDTTLTSTTALTHSDAKKTADQISNFSSRFGDIQKYVHSTIDQVAFKIMNGVNQGDSKIMLQLEPAELGRLDIKVDMNNEGKINLTILADKIETLEILNKDMKNLEKTLQDAGFKGDFSSLSFNLRDGGQQWRQPANQNAQLEPENFDLDDSEITEISTLSAQTLMMSGANRVLDIRV